MFAVPGWSVSSASLKRQTNETIDVEPEAGGKLKVRGSRKRRRTSGSSAVTKDNVAELWEKVIERKSGAQPGKQGVNALDAQRKTKKKKHDRSVDGLAGLKYASNGMEEEGQEVTAPVAMVETKSKKVKQRRREKNDEGISPHKNATTQDSTSQPTAHQDISPTASKGPGIQLTPLQELMRQKLISARFRHLNQNLYTTSSLDSFRLFQDNPEMFEEYHLGFRRQVAVWPENPVDGYIQELKRRGKIKAPPKRTERRTEDGQKPLPRIEGVCTIADLGCGEAQLARSMEEFTGRLKMRILSYDLSSPNAFVTQADIAHLPLADGSVDVAICCLALMGTNWIEFIEEAYRILRWKGELWVAEIKSRFGRVITPSSSKGRGQAATTLDSDDKKETDDAPDILDENPHRRPDEETDLSAFIHLLQTRGFALVAPAGLDLGGMPAVDTSNKMFVKMKFIKTLQPTKKGKGVMKSVKQDRRGGAGGDSGGVGGVRRGRGGGGGGIRRGRGRGRGVGHANNINDNDDEKKNKEAAVLKPCVYKLR